MTEFEIVELYVMALESADVDVTTTECDWFHIGLSLASLGEPGRDLYHRVSQLYPEYDRQECDNKYTHCINDRNGSVTLGTFFDACHKVGIKPSLNGVSKSHKRISKPVKKPESKEDEKWLYTVNDVLNAPPQETLWAFITKGVNNAIVASSEAGKSTLLLNLAIAIAREDEYFLNWPLGTPKGRCIYISTEDGIGQLKTRLTAMLKEGEPIPNNHILFILDGKNLTERLEKVLSETPADIIMIDTWGDLVGGKYDAEYTRKTMSAIREVCTKHDGTPLYVHHTNKASENIPEKSSVKGAGDFEQACRVVMMLSIYQDHRWLCCVKGNPFADDLKQKCYELSYFPDRQQFGRTGNEKSRIEIVRELRSENLGRPSTDIDFASLLDEKRMNYTNLSSKVAEAYGVAIPTAKRKIKEALESRTIQKDPNGLYYAN